MKNRVVFFGGCPRPLRLKVPGYCARLASNWQSFCIGCYSFTRCNNREAVENLWKTCGKCDLLKDALPIKQKERAPYKKGTLQGRNLKPLEASRKPLAYGL